MLTVTHISNVKDKNCDLEMSNHSIDFQVKSNKFMLALYVFIADVVLALTFQWAKGDE